MPTCSRKFFENKILEFEQEKTALAHTNKPSLFNILPAKY
jgi:hypothetical protein